MFGAGALLRALRDAHAKEKARASKQHALSRAVEAGKNAEGHRWEQRKLADAAKAHAQRVAAAGKARVAPGVGKLTERRKAAAEAHQRAARAAAKAGLPAPKAPQVVARLRDRGVQVKLRAAGPRLAHGGAAGAALQQRGRAMQGWAAHRPAGTKVTVPRPVLPKGMKLNAAGRIVAATPKKHRVVAPAAPGAAAGKGASNWALWRAKNKWRVK